MSLLDVGSAALSLVSTGIQFYSAWKGGEDKGDLYAAQAASSYADARRALFTSRLVRDVAEVEARQVQRKGAEYRSAARAAYAANGIRVDTGSAIATQRDITRRADQDAINAILLGERQGQQLEQDALASLTESGLYMQAGSNAENAGQLTAWGTALAGAADVWSKWRAAGD